MIAKEAKAVMVEEGPDRHYFGEMPHDIRMHLTGQSGIRPPRPAGDAARYVASGEPFASGFVQLARGVGVTI